MEATSVEIYNHSESYTDANQYKARNTACYNLFTHLAANPPTGWTVSSSSIPSPSSSAYGVYYVILEGQGFRMKLYTSTFRYAFVVEIQNTSGTQVMVATDTADYYCIFGTLNGTYGYTYNLTITSYATANKLYAMVFSSTQNTNKKAIAKIYTFNKSSGAEDFLIGSDFYSQARLGAMTAGVTSNSIITTISKAIKSTDGEYASIPFIVYKSSNNEIYAEMINCYMVCGEDILTAGSIYSDGTDSYLRIGHGYTAVIKL